MAERTLVVDEIDASRGLSPELGGLDLKSASDTNHSGGAGKAPDPRIEAAASPTDDLNGSGLIGSDQPDTLLPPINGSISGSWGQVDDPGRWCL